jgi:regulator of ribonuclease activity A
MNDIRTADLCDTFTADVQVCAAQFRMFGARRCFSGEIETVSTYEDAGLIRQCVEQPGQGRVLVVDGGGSTRVALLGDKLATRAIQNGWAGIIVLGAVRDTDVLATLDIGVIGLAVTPLRGSVDGAGTIGAAFQFGGAEFVSGRHVYCDADGVVVSAQPLTTAYDQVQCAGTY